jgi:predicted PurR-regulated permease PerM
MSTTASNEQKISADDLRSKIQSFQDGIQGKVESKKNTLLTAGGVTLLVLLILFFLLGKRSGKKKTTFVEIRRV